MYPTPIATLIEQLARLPGVGPKTAQRMAFFLLHLPSGEAERLADAIVEARRRIRYCSVCFNFTEDDPCTLCADPRRDDAQIVVVEQPKDVIAIEKTREYRGRYHVLHGAISPMDGVGPDDLRVRELLARLHGGTVREVILATSSSLEGEATALYLARLLKPLGVQVTRIARGIPMGGDLDYTDEVTLLKALEGRQAL
ncbi:MAG: recombination mediator RecR [Actinomycetia bacterium]|jgi:recombination protein RecR|nr:recombination mediator RecR [Actinomycetes bacterium]